MKTLLILRHAKSSWDNTHLADHDRPLKKRGRRDASRIGRLLDDEELIPDLIISSSAKRAMTTAKAAARDSGYSGDLLVTRHFYHADPESYFDVLRDISDEFSRVLIVGHNPGMEELLEEITGSYERMPTAALAHVVVSIDSWRQLDESVDALLVHFWRPKELPRL